MHGGVKLYRGAAVAARAYVEADRSRVDDYYLAEGSGLARRFGAAPGAGVQTLGVLDGDGYELWVAGLDPATGEARGRLRQDGNAVRFVEIVVNGPKTWSLAAALDSDVAAAYDAAQDKAAEQIIGWVADHATTRVGPRGRQVQVPVERIEAVTVRHYTSRAGDPHRHLHLQVNARVFANAKWRGLHTVGFRDCIEAMNGIGHAAVMTDPDFRVALAGAGFTVDPATGEITELSPLIGKFSERSAQIGRNVDRYEAEWRATNPGQEPGPAIRQSWDRRAWKDARPDKVIPTDGTQLVAGWRQQLYDLGYRAPTQPGLPLVFGTPRVGGLDRAAAVDNVLTRLGARRSAWNPADIRGEVEGWVAGTGLVAEAAVRIELAEDLTARAIEACIPLSSHPEVPEHVRCLTSPQVLAVEADIVTRLAARADNAGQPATLPRVDRLDDAQLAAVSILAGDAQFVVVDGAAGAGKTTTLAAARTALEAQGHRMLVVTPTLKAAQVAAHVVGKAGSVAWLIHQHGFRWDDDGRWTRRPPTPTPDAVLASGDLLLVDEAAMLDQDAARALLTVADETSARVAFVGDRHQLPAVGRGGVLDLAASWVRPEAYIDLDVVHRFTDPEYAVISLALRAGSPNYTVSGEASGERVGEVWAALCRRGQVYIYPSEAERTEALADLAAQGILTSQRNLAATMVMADTREQTAALSGTVRDRLVAAGHVDDTHCVVTGASERVGVGDRVATRRNDPALGVTNRAAWTVTKVGTDGSLMLRGHRATDLRTLPAGYVREHVELAYATTVYGAQGDTTGTGHLVLGEHTSAASAYVAMTRGRIDNVVHLVADNMDDAKRQWDDVFGRDRADLGPNVAAQRAALDVDRYGAQTPARRLDEVLADLRVAWTQQADLTEHQQRLIAQRDALREVAALRARFAPERQRLDAEHSTSRARWLHAQTRLADLDATVTAETTDLHARTFAAWRDDLARAQHAAHVLAQGAGRFGQRRRQMHAASDQLTAFAEAWRPVHPDLPSDPVDLASQMGQLREGRVEREIDAYVIRVVADAHPESDTLRLGERTTLVAFQAVEQARTRLDNALYEQLRPYGRAGYVTDPDERLATLTDQLGVVEQDLQTATAQVHELRNEPAVRALHEGGLDTEHHQWVTDRAAQRDATARQAQAADWRRQQQLLRIRPNPPARPDLDRGPSIGH
jgi:hypothetical protein